MPASPEVDIVVAGAGPAGAAVALALARLGYAVAVVGVPRRFAACEGVSERALKGMADAGFAAALTGLAPPSPRTVCWNGEQRAANTERLLSRERVDAGILQDLARAGVGVFAAPVAAVARESAVSVLTTTRDTQLRSRLVVDARGRSAPRGGSRLRGPETVSLLQRWSGPPGEAASSVCSFEDGWAWLARTAAGDRYTQLTLAVATPGMPKRAALRPYLLARLDALAPARDWVACCVAQGEPVARSSTAVLHDPLFEAGVLRVGDAAMAVDPLSGNGIFQALSSASVAPAVINTLLREPANAALALRFYEERVRHIFERFARVGRDFYRSETRWAAQDFWRARSEWPDDEPAHDSLTPRLLGSARRPVLDNGFIREREVLLASDQPLGVWRVADIEIAPLLASLPVATAQRRAALLARIEAAGQGDPARVRAVQAWLQRYRAFD